MMEDGVYLINVDECRSAGGYLIVLNGNDNNGMISNIVTYFDSFEVKHI